MVSAVCCRNGWTDWCENGWMNKQRAYVLIIIVVGVDRSRGGENKQTMSLCARCCCGCGPRQGRWEWTNDKPMCLSSSSWVQIEAGVVRTNKRQACIVVGVDQGRDSKNKWMTSQRARYHHCGCRSRQGQWERTNDKPMCLLLSLWVWIKAGEARMDKKWAYVLVIVVIHSVPVNNQWSLVK